MNERHFFNTTGPCKPEDHYMLPPADRLVGSQLHRYINDKLYWVLHAPRQTGKTTFLQNWAREINSSGKAVACYVSVEDCQGIAEHERAMKTIYHDICDFAKFSKLPIPFIQEGKISWLLSRLFGTQINNTSVAKYNVENLLRSTLARWSELVAPKPLIVLFDEVDVLVDDVMVSFLRQLRSGFAERGIGKFPISIALVGMRDLKDYIVRAKDGEPINPGSPFNIKEDSAVLFNFTRDDVDKLFAQRTNETGQQITREALDYVYEQSKGQPWIVNSLFKRATLRILDESSVETVTVEHVRRAREQMIEARETHLDALAYRLDDPQIRRVIELLITGESDPSLAEGETFRVCTDLGLVTTEHGTPQIANPIYKEVIARQMTFSTQLAIPEPSWQWQKPNGELDMDNLMREFQKFWRRHSEIWEERSNYTEAFPHLLLMAFLQRVTNGGGHIDREYAAGRGRMDLSVEYAGKCYIIEVKIIHYYDTPATVRKEGLTQIKQYRDNIDATLPAYLVIFDRRPQAKELTWDEKIKWNTDENNNIIILEC